MTGEGVSVGIGLSECCERGSTQCRRCYLASTQSVTRAACCLERGGGWLPIVIVRAGAPSGSVTGFGCLRGVNRLCLLTDSGRMLIDSVCTVCLSSH